MQIPTLEIIEQVQLRRRATFPYIPGLLSFRELPALCDAFKRLRHTPDAVVCDGQGIAHPRGMGLAAHLGLILDLPTVGCAKSRLVGEYRPVGRERWKRSQLRYQARNVGSVVRTRAGVKPVFVSPGHRIDIPGSIALIRKCVTRYRLPEPTRQAHILVNQYRAEQS